MNLSPDSYVNCAKQNWSKLKNSAVAAIFLGIAATLLPLDNTKAQQSTAEAPAVEAQPAQHKPTLAEAAGLAQGKVVYRDVVLIDGTSENARPDMAIVIQDDRITAIVPNSAVSEDMLDGATVYDMAGEYVLPGLIDSHVHLATLPHRATASAYMKRYIYGGITGVRDMAGDVRALADLSRASLVNEIPAPDLFYASLMAGPDFFSDPRTVTSGLGGVPGKLPWMQAITEDSEIALMVAQAKGTSATGIKIYANLPGKLVQAIIAEGKKQNFPVWSHLQVYPATPYDSLGATVASHVCMIARYVGERNKQRYGHDNPPSYEGITAEHPEIRKYISALLKSGTIMEATLSVYDEISAEQAAALNEDGTPQRPGCSRVLAAGITRAMLEAGVPIIAGTDRAAPADDPFPKLYEEMEALVSDAGLTPQQAILSATSVAARGLGKSQDIGTLEAGKFANMVFVKQDPLADISALRSISLTVKRGHRFERKDYEHKNIPELVYPE
ncbi:amidohydrolase family protein [Sphingorhabdus sp. M41]|uniref:amidohydrolase family protein n=1 Tax=Sphingorhabdus sp. M41 TaxID=1806885 RepID=UPI0018D49C72|nr:amidohydrolase family protein [Sphingorhabdus sp. M41]